jgi:hypothetical protein
MAKIKEKLVKIVPLEESAVFFLLIKVSCLGFKPKWEKNMFLKDINNNIGKKFIVIFF